MSIEKTDIETEIESLREILTEEPVDTKRIHGAAKVVLETLDTYRESPRFEDLPLPEKADIEVLRDELKELGKASWLREWEAENKGTYPDEFSTTLEAIDQILTE